MPYSVSEKADGKWGIYKHVLGKKILVGESNSQNKAEASKRIREEYMARKGKG